MKALNRNGVTASVKKLEKYHQLSRFALTKYNKLGVFLDLDCYSSDEIYSVFFSVIF